MDREIRFQPLTDGLGFHPFEDGLPYAPASKKQNQSAPGTLPAPSPQSLSLPNYGSGAVSAGRAQFAFPPTTSVDSTAEKIKRELEAIQNERLASSRAAPARTPTPLEIHYGIGYSFERAFAYLLDSAFNLSLCGSILSTALLSTDVENLRTLSSAASISVAIFLFVCNWALLAAQEVAFGTTIGKRIFGLKLEGTGVDCFKRALLFIPSLAFGGLGIFMAVFDSKKRCWHDRMTKLQPT
ncbi:MAG: RDD family protein [Cryobacterium sp.]|nr:RDD family protein [Oligoflexia bacterium]